MLRLPGSLAGALALTLAAAVAQAAPARGEPLEAEDSPAVPPARPVTIYVRDLAHLTELVKGDPLVGPQAYRLVGRRNAAIGMLAAGNAIGLTLILAGIWLIPAKNCSFDLCYSEPNWPLMGTGAFLMVLSNAIPAFLWPRQTDLIGVLNQWNARHPDRAYEMGSGITAQD